METVATEPEAVQKTLANKLQVLSIGDREKRLPSRKLAEANKQSIHDDFLPHLAKLILGTRHPPEIIENWVLYDCIKVGSTGNPKRYGFYYNRPAPNPLLSGCPFHRQSLMDRVKERFSAEKWVSDFEIETPLKTKPAGLHYRSDIYIQNAVSDCFDQEEEQIFKYVYYQHEEYMKSKKI
ncbi:uncharacterized protein LOC108594725 [Drosophila busckii]|uniref:uncharacterized protein LOC108594725 n=1 Tax=Drosophila busckii TaxID=30019 RepID=UPI00083F12A9|nr:uncharacterized protein LOC108594725 [Drosophila busckii]